MNAKELFYKRNIIITLLIAVGGLYIALRFHDECYRGMENGITFCLEVLVPSLYFFMIVAAFFVQSGAACVICRPLGGVSRALFRLPSDSMAVILLAVIGGYPVGAASAAMMRKKGRLSPTQAAKTAYIAVAAGPGFLISYIGAALLEQPQSGYILLAAQTVAVLLTGVIVGRTVKSEPLPYPTKHDPPHGNLLIDAVNSASRSVLGMCAMVVLFCALSEVLDAVIADRTVCDIASAILEITNGCNRLSPHVPLYITAFFIGFGGLSVHFQIFALLAEVPVKKGLFFLFRIIEGIITMTATYIFLMVMPTTAAVFSSTSAVPAAARSATLAGSAALVISSLLFIGSLSKKSVLVHQTQINRR